MSDTPDREEGTIATTAPATERRPEEGIGICLSGGGYRAMLFHVGTLWRLNEVGLLTSADRISSVSGTLRGVAVGPI